MYAYVYCSSLHMKRAKAGTDYNSTVLPVIASLKNKQDSIAIAQ